MCLNHSLKKGLRTTATLLKVTYGIFKAMDAKSRTTVMVLLDFSKAFELADSHLFLFKTHIANFSNFLLLFL